MSSRRNRTVLLRKRLSAGTERQGLPDGRLLLRGARFVQRAVRAAHDAAYEVVLRCDEPVCHFQRSVDDSLTAGRAVTDRGKSLIDGVEELTHRVEGGQLAGLDGLEHCLRQVRRPGGGSLQLG